MLGVNCRIFPHTNPTNGGGEIGAGLKRKRQRRGEKIYMKQYTFFLLSEFYDSKEKKLRPLFLSKPRRDKRDWQERSSIGIRRRQDVLDAAERHALQSSRLTLLQVIMNDMLAGF